MRTIEEIEHELQKGEIALLFDTKAENVSPFVLVRDNDRRLSDPRWIRLTWGQAMEEAYSLFQKRNPRAFPNSLGEMGKEFKNTYKPVDGLYGVKINWFGCLQAK